MHLSTENKRMDILLDHIRMVTQDPISTAIQSGAVFPSIPGVLSGGCLSTAHVIHQLLSMKFPLPGGAARPSLPYCSSTTPVCIPSIIVLYLGSYGVGSLQPRAALIDDLEHSFSLRTSMLLPLGWSSKKDPSSAVKRIPNVLIL